MGRRLCQPVSVAGDTDSQQFRRRGNGVRRLAPRRAFSAVVRCSPLGICGLRGRRSDSARPSRFALLDSRRAFRVTGLTNHFLLAYDGNQLNMLKALGKHTEDWLKRIQHEPYLIGTYTLLTEGMMMWSPFAHLGGECGGTTQPDGEDLVLWPMFATVLFSIWISGAPYYHY